MILNRTIEIKGCELNVAYNTTGYYWLVWSGKRDGWERPSKLLESAIIENLMRRIICS